MGSGKGGWGAAFFHAQEKNHAESVRGQAFCGVGGLIAPEATVPDLLALNAAQRQQLALQLAEVKNRYRL